MLHAIRPGSAALAVIDWTGRLLLAVLVLASLAFVFTAISVENPDGRLAAERQALEAAEREDRTFCEQFGMPAGSQSYENCAAALTRIREMYEERRGAPAPSLL